MPSDRGLNRLTDPPYSVRDELDAAVRIELPGRGHQTKVALTNQIHERHPPVLELLGNRDHEAHVVPRQLLLGLDVPSERATRQGSLLLNLEERNPADLLKVEVEALASLVGRSGKRLRARPPGPAGTLLGSRHLDTPMDRYYNDLRCGLGSAVPTI